MVREEPHPLNKARFLLSILTSVLTPAHSATSPPSPGPAGRLASPAAARLASPGAQLGLQLALALGLVLAGVWGGSSALAMSAALTLRDALSAALATGRGQRLAAQQGHKLAAVLIAAGSLMILLTVAAVGGVVLHRVWMHSGEPPAAWVLWVAGAAAVLELLLGQPSRLSPLPRHQRNANRLTAHALMQLAVAASVLVARQGATQADAVMAAVVALVALAHGWGLLRGAAAQLVDAALPSPQQQLLRASVAQLPQVKQVSGLTTLRAADGTAAQVSLTLHLPARMPLQQAEALRPAVEAAVARAVGPTPTVHIAYRAAMASPEPLPRWPNRERAP